jgi:hypothetical protein
VPLQFIKGNATCFCEHSHDLIENLPLVTVIHTNNNTQILHLQLIFSLLFSYITDSSSMSHCLAGRSMADADFRISVLEFVDLLSVLGSHGEVEERCFLIQ